MSASILDARGRTTVPREVRDCIGAGPGGRLVWHVMPSGALSVCAKGPCGWISLPPISSKRARATP